MPYWIEQTEGPHKTAIDEAVAEYRSGTSPQATWGRLAALYRKVMHRTSPQAIRKSWNVAGRITSGI